MEQTSCTEEQKKKLYEDQKRLLDTFWERGAISREQYETSLRGLTEKMHLTPTED